jgi:hypothetical protein
MKPVTPFVICLAGFPRVGKLTIAHWVNLVERFFADITEMQIRRGVHGSAEELETAIRSLENFRDRTSAAESRARRSCDIAQISIFLRVPPRLDP